MRQECHSRSRSLGGTLRVLMGIGELKNEQKTGWQKKITEEATRAIMPVYLIGYGKEFVSCYFRGYFRALTLKRFTLMERRINRAIIPLDSRNRATRQKNSFATFVS